MSISESVLDALLKRSPHLRPQLYFKSSLTALSHAMEDQVLASSGQPLIIASFQRERFYRQESHRYLRIAALTPQVYVLAAPETDFMNRSEEYETVAFDPSDQLSQEWHLVVIGQQYSACLVCRERTSLPSAAAAETTMDQTRRFEGVWTFDRQVSYHAAEILLDRILTYRPELAEKIAAAKTEILLPQPAKLEVDPDPFAQRLVTHLQAGQYKLLKAYRSIATQERKERLVNSITTAMRQSLNTDDIFRVAVDELGKAMQVCRCIIYRCKDTDTSAKIAYEYRRDKRIASLVDQDWPLRDNPMFQAVAQQQTSVAIRDAIPAGIANTSTDPQFDLSPLKPVLKRASIRSWLMVPVVNQGRLLGMVELHHCQKEPHPWTDEERSLVESVASQLGVAILQAESYANLEDLNEQLEALERTRSNLIAITGHELRTPLSTIQVCLESLASEPDMPTELRQVMLSTALSDAERMRKLVQDFLTLSRLESGRVEWHLEPLALQECVDLALSSLRTRELDGPLPKIETNVSGELPLVKADGEWLVEVLAKLLDNACKFTESTGEVMIEAHQNGGKMLEVTIADTGRGIEPNRLEVVFDRFYQEEGALRRTAGGTGLGLAICRQIILALGGQIWAESGGRDQGSQFHFTLPLAQETAIAPAKAKGSRS
ncbi:DICT sensory domain-containing protein [Leptolyngbya sp. O-77]|uniref:DICT sensory domain-containing protein n=1 Tax=Leptolyngbya sp. O-77 TaxID=1080068 RepID=UPI00074D46DD|nr:DICT sensory domain-containing protein [Leptolyngbya sp. O-77]BAU40403.1 Sensor histidine kinase YycG [Leptolyngbya sp. O-77]